MMRKMCGGHKVAWVLLIIGGLNWGLVGVLDYNLISSLFGSVSWLERLIYILVGVSAIMMLGVGRCCLKGGHCGKCKDGKCACGHDKCPHCGKSPCVCGHDGPKEDEEETDGGDESGS